MGALRSGAGLVTVATPASCLPIVAAMAPEYMTEPLAETGDGTGRRRGSVDRVLELSHDVIACGPGLGRDAGVARVRARRWSSAPTVPLVLDADALTVLADDPAALVGRRSATSSSRRIRARWRG